MTGNSLVNNLALNGTLNFVPPVAAGGFKTLTVEGTLSGNGSLYMNTNLAALQGDMVVAEATSGQHNVYINNQGEAGRPRPIAEDHRRQRTFAEQRQLRFAQRPGRCRSLPVFLLPGAQVAGGDAGDWYLANTIERSNLTNDALAAANAVKFATYASLNSLQKRLGANCVWMMGSTATCGPAPIRRITRHRSEAGLIKG